MMSPGVEQTGRSRRKDCETDQLGRQMAVSTSCAASFAARIAVRSAPILVQASLLRLAAHFDRHFAFFQVSTPLLSSAFFFYGHCVGRCMMHSVKLFKIDN